ncbi:MAG: phosphodiester glycosidase family protein [Bacilli bacterium]|nr:phosphodiester glycosidase family protein [Bacilli bacterium]
MKGAKKIIIPVVFALVGTSFVAYSFLDTFVIPKEYGGVFNANQGASNFSFSFADMNKSSSSSSSSNSQSQSSSSSSSSSASIEPAPEYYEDLTPEEIDALFTPEVVFEPKKHYSDPDIYVDITTDRYKDHSTYYAADIRIRNASYLKTALAKDKAGENITEFTSEMCKRHKGIIAIDGDTYGAQNSGYVIRNGQIIRSSRNTGKGKGTDLAIYADGSFEIFNEKDYTLNEIAAKGAWQVFSFGPALVDKGVRVIDKGVEVETAATQNRNQRCAIGMIAPLHYIFVVSDGRIASSPGLSLYQIGRIMEINHAYCAYNLDGGGSATMYFDDGTGNANGNGALVNYCTQELVHGSTLPENPPIGERGVSDCVYIGKE